MSPRSVVEQMHVQESDTENSSSTSCDDVHRRDPKIRYNIGRNFKERLGYQTLMILKGPTICRFCQARLFQGEPKTFCCNEGKTILPAIPVPMDLLHIFIDQSTEGKSFRQNIRSYNHVFAFTSMGVTLDNRFTKGQGVYTFRAHGSIYHKVGPLLPAPGNRPRFIQMFIFDTEHETENRLLEINGLNRNLVEKIRRVLDANNPFVQTFRQIAQHPDLPKCKLVIKERHAAQRQYVIPSASQVAAIISMDEIDGATNRDIVVHATEGGLIRIKEFSGFYDPLQYPLFLPYGTYGWDVDSRTIHGKKVTCCDYYAYMLQIRENPSILLHGGRLLQQYVVDNYVKIETQKLRWIRFHQEKIRSELYQGLQDCLNAGEIDGGNVGRRIILPSSFIGGERDMYQHYQDAMAVVQKLGKPDIFLTMTCNPNWKEIHDQLLPGQTPQDRPDLLTRVFRAKYEKLKVDIYTHGVLGKVIGHVHVIEFQKRGLPHVHMLIILHEDDRLNTPDDYDCIVTAEIPNQDEQPLLYAAVLRHMIHGPCGQMDVNAPCMKDRKCKKNYPKQFAPATIQGNDSYPIYRRRDDGRSIPLDVSGDKCVDNRYVVPYNSWLLLKYNCHINVEACRSIKSIKYLYKYIHKGPDHIAAEVRTSDEISKYVDGRWICAPEALWKMFKFPISRIYPSVIRLHLHLPNMQNVQYKDGDRIDNVLSNEKNTRSMLTEFFKLYSEGTEVEKYLYIEFPRYYRWDQSNRFWVKRKSNQKVIGRIYAALPNEGERFYLRMLLNHVRGPSSFTDILTVNGMLQSSFRQAAEMLGILEEDDSIRQCLDEARMVRMPSALRRLFATILAYCAPTGVRRLWDENYSYMIEDYHSTNTPYCTNKLLRDIQKILLHLNKNLHHFDLPELSDDFPDLERRSRLIEEELSVTILETDFNSVAQLNTAQLHAFNTIQEAIRSRNNAIFFVDGPGGTGKTFLYRALLASCRRSGLIVLATATSGIAATQLPGGRTAHSRLGIPSKLNSHSVCNFSKQSEMARLLNSTSAIVWDEAPMANRGAIETVDRTLRDVLGVDLPFGGKIMIFGGDFRQVLPVIVGGTRSQAVNASIVQSYLWSDVTILRLEENIRAQLDHNYSDFLLRVGDGDEPIVQDDMIHIPDSMVIPWEGESSINKLIEFVYPDLAKNLHDVNYILKRAIITPKNDEVNRLNEKIIELLSHDVGVTYYSFDSVVDDKHNFYLPEFLNSLTPGNLPPHKLVLKKGCPIMLLRNIDPKLGLCNGTRLVCHSFGRNVIDAEILTGEFKGTRVFLPRIPLRTSDDANLPFQMTRKQFPVRLSFALTINKSQGQTIPHVGIYIPDHVFSHGQLYVALSRGISQATTKLLVRNSNLDGYEGSFTRNVVYPELFSRLKNIQS